MSVGGATSLALRPSVEMDSPLPGWKMLASTRPMTTATAVVTR